MQANLVYWYTDRVASYEPNVKAAYNLSRNGKMFRVTSERLGSVAAHILSVLQSTGSSTVEVILRNWTSQKSLDLPASKLTNGDLPNGNIEDGRALASGDSDYDDAYQTLCNLLKAGLIRKTHKSLFRTAADNALEAATNAKPVDEYTGNKKEKQARRDKDIEDILAEWRYGTMQEKAEIETLQSGRKRRLEDVDETQPYKKVRATAGDSSHLRREPRTVPDDTSTLLDQGRLKVGV